MVANNRLSDRTNALYKDYEKLNADFENLNVTSNKIIKRFKKINQGDINDEKE